MYFKIPLNQFIKYKLNTNVIIVFIYWFAKITPKSKDTKPIFSFFLPKYQAGNSQHTYILLFMYSIHREALIIYLLPFYIPNEITGTPNKLQFLFVYTVYTLVCQNTTHKSPGTKQICFLLSSEKPEVLFQDVDLFLTNLPTLI